MEKLIKEAKYTHQFTDGASLPKTITVGKEWSRQEGLEKIKETIVSEFKSEHDYFSTYRQDWEKAKELDPEFAAGMPKPEGLLDKKILPFDENNIVITYY